ncbi:hypothetical protein, partial [Chromobacterium haemolyticum]|uniref:hypothetical protein n=1 Tax=Chromobacterium haemolyticum TaxID=394935 RepID=UPI0019626A14
RDPGLAVPTAESLFGSEELEKARKEWNRRLEQCPAEQRPLAGAAIRQPGAQPIPDQAAILKTKARRRRASPSGNGFEPARRWTDNRDTLIRVRFGSPRQGSQSRVLAQLTSSARPRQAVP